MNRITVGLETLLFRRSWSNCSVPSRAWLTAAKTYQTKQANTDRIHFNQTKQARCESIRVNRHKIWQIQRLNFPRWPKTTRCMKIVAIFLFFSLKQECRRPFVVARSVSKSLVWHGFWVMIWDVISAEQESKQQHYLQKVSHMLNQ